jgi:uncharacterized protein (DUF58 family)
MQWKFRHRRPKIDPPVPLPHCLVRRQIYILPTRHGLVFLLILFAMLIGSANYNNNLGFLLTFLLGSMAFVSILHTFRNLSGIQIAAVTGKPVFAGNDATIELAIKSHEHTRMAVSFKFAQGQYHRQNLETAHDNRITLTVPTSQRGRLHPGRLTVFSRYPLGLFYAWSPFTPETDCIVYPQPLLTPFITANGTVGETDQETLARKPGVDDFEGLRLYQPGDPLQRISWKAYSRGLGLMTKQFVGTTGASPLLDWDMFQTKNAEKRLSMLSYLVLQAHRMNITYGLRLPGVEIVPAKGATHKHKCLKALALYKD